MDQSHGSQNVGRPSCKSGKKRQKKSREHSRTKDYVKVATRRSLRQIDLLEKVNVKNNVELSSAKRGEDSVKESQSGHDEMDQSDAGQKNKRKCVKQNKDDVQVASKKTSRKCDFTSKIKLKNCSNVSVLHNVRHRKDAEEENQNSHDKKYWLRSGKNDNRPPLNMPVSKYTNKNKERLDKYKHKPTKVDVNVIKKKISRKRDSTGKVVLNNCSNKSSGVGHRKYFEEVCPSSHDNKYWLRSGKTNSRPPFNKSVRKYAKKNKERVVKYKHKPTKDDVKVDSKKKSLNRNSKEKVKLNNSSSDESSIVHRKYSDEESQSSHDDSVDDSDGLIVADWNEQISKLFLVGDMPREFFDFWAFCKKQNPRQPEDALLPFGLKLVGPFDVLAGHMNAHDPAHLEKGVLHWRYYYDPPEFQTIIASVYSQFHVGYFRDNPLDCPIAIVSNDPEENGIIKMAGRSLFAILRKYLDNFNDKLAQRFFNKLIRFETRGVPYMLKGRRNNPVANTFNTFGISVPYDVKTDYGYRPLLVSDEYLQEMFKCYHEVNVSSDRIEKNNKLQSVINYAITASNENDFGTQLELGIDIFCDGNPKLHNVCKSLLFEVYNLLKRPQFATILKTHLANRRKGQYMSIL